MRLNNILTQPEILAKMSKPNNSNDYLKKMKKEEERKKVISKLNNAHKDREQNEDKVSSLIDQMNKNDISNIVNFQLNNQEQSFKSRLEKKRNRKRADKSDIDNISAIGLDPESKIVIDKEEKVLDMENLLNNIQYEDTKFKDNEDKKSEGSGLEDKERNKTGTIKNGSKGLIATVNSSITSFVEDFSMFFSEKFFKQAIENINRINEEKIVKVTDMLMGYNMQIKEMEVLINGID